ncbi:MAG: hypothetical protein KDG50_03100 [Chromatiales bacterium]|nr:hypothetical protein [Chromatiales bacterium]
MNHSKLTGNLRFIANISIAAIGLASWIGLVVFIDARIPGGIGLTLALVGGSAFVLGLILTYIVVVDWLNLRFLRPWLSDHAPAMVAGEHVAFAGIVRTDSEPMIAPFTDEPCLMYRYSVTRNVRKTTRSGGTRQFIAQGFHLLPSRIEGNGRSLALRSFPVLDDSLLHTHEGREWSAKANRMMQNFDLTAPDAGQRERESRHQEVLHSVIDEVHEDYLMTGIVRDTDLLAIQEESLPVDTNVCAIGTYDAAGNALTGTKPRVGPNLMIYRGTAHEVLERLRAETAKYSKIAMWMVGVGVLITMLAALPASVTSRIPVIGWPDQAQSR